MKQYKRSIVLFHRDLRIEDNRTLGEAMERSDEIVPVFIFDPVQVSNTNTYGSQNALQFMVASLHDLAEQIRSKSGVLYCFHGNPLEILSKVVKEVRADAVFSHRDYTPFAVRRDEALQKKVQLQNAAWVMVNDLLLTDPTTLLTGSGTPFKVYTAFLRKASAVPVAEPQTPHRWSWYTHHIPHIIDLVHFSKSLFHANPLLYQTGGSSAAHKIVQNIADFKHYNATRNSPFLPTTGLSAHLKFGTLSIRQVYKAMRMAHVDEQLIKELYWRDFFTSIGYHFPYVFGNAFISKFDALSWSHNKQWFEHWCEGTTGFPLVDAGMRQLNTTGFMHNRVRMVVASFLTKDMLIDWRWGEHYFAQKLTDYDPCVNNGNWQWSASIGADAQPYFRIFNPWMQQKRFDPACQYIKQWIPELADLPVKDIHRWFKATVPYKGYPIPLLDHTVQSKKALQFFRTLGR